MKQLLGWLSVKSKILFREKKVLPKCYNAKFLHHLGADEIYYPCCFMRVGQGRRELNELLGADISFLNIRNHSQSEILRSPAWRRLYLSFYSKPLATCLEFCPKEHSKKFLDKGFDGVNRPTTFQAKPAEDTY